MNLFLENFQLPSKVSMASACTFEYCNKFCPSFQKFNPAIFLKSAILESLSTCIFLKSLSKIRWDFSSYTFKPSWCYFLMETTSVLGNYLTLINIMNKFQMNLRSNIVYISLFVKVQLATLFRFVDF